MWNNTLAYVRFPERDGLESGSKKKFIIKNVLKVKVLVTWSCPTLCNPMNCSPPGSSVHEIL